MANKAYEENDIAAIASTIREKTGTDKKYAVSRMAEGVDEVYEKGKFDTELALWKAITVNGSRNTWDYAFAYADYSDIEFPKPIVMSGKLIRTFRMYAGKKLPRKQDIDLSGVTSQEAPFSYIYGADSLGNWRRVTIPDYGLPALDSLDLYFSNAQCVETIELVRCHKNTSFNSTFTRCDILKEIRFDGVIGQSISFLHSPLSMESVQDIIIHLKDYSDKSANPTLTLKDTVKDELQALTEIVEYEGQTYTYYELATDVKNWNIA